MQWELVYQSNQLELASKLFAQMTVAEDFEDFLTVPGYKYL
jgi:hypothetical protein